MKLIFVLLLSTIVSSCGTIILPKFPKASPHWKYTVYLHDVGGAYTVRCLKRCYSLTMAKRVNPDKCGMDWKEGEPVQWYTENPLECNTVDGFTQKAWTDDIYAWLKEMKRYINDHLEMINEKIQEVLDNREETN